jgi:hypothetical protein
MKHRAAQPRPTAPVLLATDQLARATGGDEPHEANAEKIKS